MPGDVRARAVRDHGRLRAPVPADAHAGVAAAAVPRCTSPQQVHACCTALSQSAPKQMSNFWVLAGHIDDKQQSSILRS